MQDWKKLAILPAATVRRAIEAIDSGGCGIALVVAENGRLEGTITDGDVRRALLRGITLEGPAAQLMQRSFRHCTQGTSAADMLSLMQAAQIHQLPVLDSAGRLVGVHTLDELLAVEEQPHPVVLMAGGLGARLRPLTENLPKPMLNVGSRPLLETIIEQFTSQGFRNLWVSVNYRGEQIREYFGDGSRWGARIRYIEESMRMGTAGALSVMDERPTAPVIVMNGDVLTRVDFRQLIQFHLSSRAEATIAVREFIERIPYGVVRFDGHALTDIEEKPLVKHFVSAGIYVLAPQVLGIVPANRHYDMPDLFRTLLGQGRPAAVFPIREYWMDIGRFEDYERANLDYDAQFR